MAWNSPKKEKTKKFPPPNPPQPLVPQKKKNWAPR